MRATALAAHKRVLMHERCPRTPLASGSTRDREELGAEAPPAKRIYRQRAHSNPLSDHSIAVPRRPSSVDWSVAFPERARQGLHVDPTIADVGCGFGGLSLALSHAFPAEVVLGMELRKTVAQYVRHRIESLRRSRQSEYQNVACVRANAMRSLPNYFRRAQLRAMVFAFPDPHFKAQNFRRRLIQRHLLDEYAYALCEGGMLYTVTDVEGVADWNANALDTHPLFERLSADDLQLQDDPVPALMASETEEGRKVQRSGGTMWHAAARRLPNSAADTL
jgi:tRNA (guanine-N7-)-methyltransferase